MQALTFALYFGNRGFFPETLIASSREELCSAVEHAGHRALLPAADLTRFGAVETRQEGEAYARWLRSHRGGYDGVILCLPNFGDENGAVAALEDCGVPILIQAYPDELGKMDFAHRRDSFCGKLSIENLFRQHGLPFTALPPHVVHPASGAFQENLRDFAAICRVVKGMRRFTVGAVGARATKFKTVRFDELTLQKYGVSVETLDLSELFARAHGYAAGDGTLADKAAALRGCMDCGGVPPEKLDMLARVGAALDDIIDEYGLDGLALRCWDELHDQLGIAPCLLLSALNGRGFPAACETDLYSVCAMRALTLASGEPTACLDWNNNYGDDPDKVILFHCGQVAPQLTRGAGTVIDHKMFAKGCPGSGWGSHEGRLDAFPMTFASCKTEDGLLSFCLGEGAITDDPIESAFFGTGGVAEIPGLQTALLRMGKGGYRHHTVIGRGRWESVLREAFGTYLGYGVTELR